MIAGDNQAAQSKVLFSPSRDDGGQHPETWMQGLLPFVILVF